MYYVVHFFFWEKWSPTSDDEMNEIMRDEAAVVFNEICFENNLLLKFTNVRKVAVPCSFTDKFCSVLFVLKHEFVNPCAACG